jgi:hypothetical protein
MNDMTSWQPISTAPVGKEMFVVIASGVHTKVIANYTSDPYCVWQHKEGIFSRWPHDNFNPTHWMPLPERPKNE